jgi:hypothetical protein
MALHTIAFFENQDGGGALQPLAALADPLSPLFKVESGDFLICDSRLRFLVGGHFHVDATVQPRARLVAPSIKSRYNGRTAIEVPALASTIEPASPPVMNDWRAQPYEFDGGERLSLETLNNPAAAADQAAVLYMSDGAISPVDPRGGYWARFTTTAAAVTADTWNSRALTADETLRKGRYEVLGGRVISTTLIQARLNFPLGGHARPPVASADARADIPAPMLQPGQLGVLGAFDDDNLPVVELFVDAADNEVQVVDLFIRPVGTGKR